MLPLLLVTSVVIVFFISKMEPLFRTVQQKLDRLNTVLQENIAGARLVKAFVRADFESERFETANEDFTDHSVKVMRFMSTMSPALTVFVNIGMVIVIWAGGLQAIHGNMTDRADRGLHQLPAHHHDPPDHDDHALPNLGERHRLCQACQRGAGYRPRGAGCSRMRIALPEHGPRQGRFRECQLSL